MRVNIKTSFMIVFFIIVQLLVDNYLSLGAHVYLTILPILILSFSYKYETISMMLIAFALGMSLDIFGNGTLGLNASALVAVAFTRKTSLKHLVNHKNIEKLSAPSSREMGIGSYLIYLIFSYTIFFAIYIPLESMSIYPILPNLIKLFLSIVISVIIAYLLGSLFQNKR